VPIGPERLIEDNYIDAYIRILIRLDVSQTLSASVVFNCGMGVVRTTFAMIAASLVRRKQLIRSGLPDPFLLSGVNVKSPPSSGRATV
jgi:hypothetical protein